MHHPDSFPVLLIADKDGKITEFPELLMAGMSNGRFLRPGLDRSHSPAARK